ncbi:hypothetical protein BaRGS_00001128 [Batillaria attramentaria]|uniref:LITAF domain-containing protein n=1 Tax=Batillaria attramentaria TaxID=370345 RepID=A0ABD0M6U1_9CAEN
MSVPQEPPPPYQPPPDAAYPPNPNAPQPADYAQPQGYGYSYNQQIAHIQQHDNATIVVVHQPTVAVVQRFHRAAVHTICPVCQAEIITSTRYETGSLAWIACLIICLCGCDLGCCLIPFFIDDCKDVVHSCPNCFAEVARWSRM